MSDISLSKAVRSNLLSLQNTAEMMATTQNRLATGKKVNSALDNPVNFFTASALNSRAGDINALMDDMANGIQTLEAADNALTAITKTLESMQSTLRQARQDKSFQTASYTINLGATPAGTEQLSLSGGALAADLDIDLTTETAATSGTSTISGTGFEAIEFSVDGTDEDTLTFDIDIDGSGTATSITISQSDVNTALGTNRIESLEELAQVITANTDFAALDASVGVVDGNLVFTSEATGEESAVAITAFQVNDVSGEGDISLGTWNPSPVEVEGQDATFAAKSVDTLVSEINNNTSVNTAIRASNDNGKLRIENLSTQDMTATTPTGVSGETTIRGNSVRADLADQYNELRDQLDKLADDASFNGINLLRGDNLKITFNETGTSEINIQAKGGDSINSANLDIPTNMEAAQFDSDDAIDGFLSQVKTAINSVRSQASAFGSSLSIVENRQNFSKNMINTLETGAANLTLADANEEAANLLALQTRQQLSSTALSMASQADQAVLRLF